MGESEGSLEVRAGVGSLSQAGSRTADAVARNGDSPDAADRLKEWNSLGEEILRSPEISFLPVGSGQIRNRSTPLEGVLHLTSDGAALPKEPTGVLTVRHDNREVDHRRRDLVLVGELVTHSEPLSREPFRGRAIVLVER